MKWWQVLIISILVCAPALFNYFKPQFFHLHDWTHVARLVEMDRALKDGHFPVRWSKDLGFGYGLPQFNFYAPLFYYWAEIFYSLGISALWAIKLVVILNYWLSFIAIYYLAAKVFNRYAGLIAGVAFIYMPYRAVDTYVRGAFAELTAITFLALTLAMINYWTCRPSLRRAVLVALAWAGIWLSHNITGLISFPFICLTIIALAAIQKPPRRPWWLEAGFILLLSFALAAFYLVPMIFENHLTMANTLTAGFSDFHQHFLYLRQFLNSAWGYGGSIFGVNDDMSFRIGNLQLVLAGISIMMGIIWRRRLSKLQLTWLVLSLICVVIALLMSTFKTQKIWEVISFLKFVQFPWRFLTIIITYTAFLSGSALFWLSKASLQNQRLAATVTALGLLVLNLAYFRPEAYLINNQDLYFTDTNQIATRMSPIIPDFITRNSAAVIPSPPAQRLETIPPVNDFRLEVDRTSEFLASLPVTVPTRIKINILWFPGWKIFVNGQKVQPEIDPVWPIMSVSLLPQPGTVYVSGVFADTPLRQMANIISLSALLLICFILLKPYIKKLPKYA